MCLKSKNFLIALDPNDFPFMEFLEKYCFSLVFVEINYKLCECSSFEEVQLKLKKERKKKKKRDLFI